MSFFDLFATIMLVIFIMLIIYRQRIGWVFGSIGWSIYCVILFQEGLFFQSGLQVYYVAMAAYGFISWTNNRSSDGQLVVEYWKTTPINIAWFGGLIAIAFIASSIAGMFTQGNMMFADATIATVAVFATYLQTRSKVEGWYYWIFTNTLVAAVAFLSGIYFLFLLGIFMVVMNTVGAFQWRKQYALQQQQKQQQSEQPQSGQPQLGQPQ